MDTYRMVGCICNPGDTHVKWMWVYENKPKRCSCGYWFKLKKHEAVDMYNLPI